MFFDFNQNNSGGFFIVNDKVCNRIFIEADNAKEAISKAEELGCYWHGVAAGLDCPCCGDRWYKPFDDDKGISFPYTYSKRYVFNDIEDYAQFLADNFGWTIPEARIYYKNGEAVEIFSKLKYLKNKGGK